MSTGFTSTRPEPRRFATSYQVSNIFLPLIAFMVIPLKITSSARFKPTGREGMPKAMKVPPRFITAKPSWKAGSAPLISRTTSTPSPRVMSITASRAFVLVTSTTWSGLNLRIKSSLYSCIPQQMRFVAPYARAIPAAKIPIGPSPKITTDFPATLASLTQYVALPNGSWIEAISHGRDLSFFMQQISGTAMYSAKQPSRSTPSISTFWQMCIWPVRHWKHPPQGMCVSAETWSPTAMCSTWLPTSTTSPENSWPKIIGGLMRPADQGSQL